MAIHSSGVPLIAVIDIDSHSEYFINPAELVPTALLKIENKHNMHTKHRHTSIGLSTYLIHYNNDIIMYINDNNQMTFIDYMGSKTKAGRVLQTNKQTNKQTNRQTDRQTEGFLPDPAESGRHQHQGPHHDEAAADH